MLYVLSLIGASEPCALDAAAIAAACSVLPSGGEPTWLAERVAAEVLFETDPEAVPALHAAVVRALNGAPVDVNILGAEGRAKRLLVADMDSTMIEQECIDELADFVGLKREVAAITERAMRGEIAFEPALRERVALLKDIPVGAVDGLIAERLTLMPGGRTLVQTMRAHGVHTCLVSGGFTLFTGPISAMIGFHEHRSNVLGVAEGRLTGTVEDPVVGQAEKRAALIGLRETLGLAPAATLAVGDGANDLDMLTEAGLGVAFRAKPAVAAAARVRVEYGDLSALLYLQGYAAAEFVG